MTKTLNINEISIQTVINSAKRGDEIVLEEDGKPFAKITPIDKPKVQKQRIAGLGKGTTWMSEDFDDELPDEFWGFEKELGICWLAHALILIYLSSFTPATTQYLFQSFSKGRGSPTRIKYLANA